MKLEIENYLTLSDVPSSIWTLIADKLSLPNPAYFKMLKMGNSRAAYGLQSHIKYYEVSKDKTKMRVGRGCHSWIRELCKQKGIVLTEVDNTVLPNCVVAPSKVIPFRSYQKGIVEIITLSRNGVVRLGTGYGKTLMMLAAAQRLQTKTLIIVPRKTLADQVCQESEKFLGMGSGRLDKNWNDRSASIHVTTIQALQHKSKEELAEISKDYGLVCADECHQVPAKRSLEIIQTFNPRYLYGFTGTARRTDGQGDAIRFIFGPILVDRDLPSSPPKVEVIKTGRNYFVFEYNELAEALSQDKVRNELITKVVKKEVEEYEKRILVFTKRCEHRDVLYETISQALSPTGNGVHVIKASGSAKEKRETQELLKSLRSGERDFSVLVSTHSLLSVGFDCPSLDTLLFAGDLRSDVLAEQSVGRIKRLFEGKKDPKIIDLADSHGILYNQFKARLAFYKSKDWQVEL